MNSETATITIPDESLDLASMRYLNESAVRDHALLCSAKFRANRFTRVGEDFIDELKADLESVIRHLNVDCKTVLNDPLTPDVEFVTGALLKKMEPVLNKLIGRLIQNKVQRQPSTGKTLGRTR